MSKYTTYDKHLDGLEEAQPDLSGALPCPTCGYAPNWEKRLLQAEYCLFCDLHHLDGPWAYSIDKAIEYWNTACEDMKGEDLKAEGVQQVAENNEVWMHSALMVIKAHASTASEFTVEDVRRDKLIDGLPQPKHPNAWGAAFSVAAKQGLIVRVGYQKNRLASAHGRIVATWKGKS